MKLDFNNRNKTQKRDIGRVGIFQKISNHAAKRAVMYFFCATLLVSGIYGCSNNEREQKKEKQGITLQMDHQAIDSVSRLAHAGGQDAKIADRLAAQSAIDAPKAIAADSAAIAIHAEKPQKMTKEDFTAQFGVEIDSSGAISLDMTRKATANLACSKGIKAMVDIAYEYYGDGKRPALEDYKRIYQENLGDRNPSLWNVRHLKHQNKIVVDFIGMASNSPAQVAEAKNTGTANTDEKTILKPAISIDTASAVNSKMKTAGADTSKVVAPKAIDSTMMKQDAKDRRTKLAMKFGHITVDSSTVVRYENQLKRMNGNESAISVLSVKDGVVTFEKDTLLENKRIVGLRWIPQAQLDSAMTANDAVAKKQIKGREIKDKKELGAALLALDGARTYEEMHALSLAIRDYAADQNGKQALTVANSLLDSYFKLDSATGKIRMPGSDLAKNADLIRIAGGIVAGKKKEEIDFNGMIIDKQLDPRIWDKKEYQEIINKVFDEGMLIKERRREEEEKVKKRSKGRLNGNL